MAQVSWSPRSGSKEIGQLGVTWHLSQPLLSPQSLDEALKYCNYVFTIVFVFEAALKLVAFGFRRFFKDRCVVLEVGRLGPQVSWDRLQVVGRRLFSLQGELWLSGSYSKPWPQHPKLPPWLARWNQLDLAIVLLSIMGIALEEIEMNAALPINPTIIRIMRVLRIARGRWPLCALARVSLGCQ